MSDAITRANLDKRTARKMFRDDFMREISKIRENLDREATEEEENGSITVCVRVRPLFPDEIKKGAFNSVSCKDPFIYIHDCRMHADMKRMFINTVSYQFNKVYDESSANEDIYMESFVDLIAHVFSFKGNGTCIMYGQTGTGKTYTMSNLENFLAHDIFNQKDIKNGKVSISLCCFEISGKKCFDLFNFEDINTCKENYTKDGNIKNKKINNNNCYKDNNNNNNNVINHHHEVFLREGEDKQIHVRGVKYINVNSEDEFMKYIEISRKERTSSSTFVNESSSRTHGIIRIIFTTTSLSKYPNESRVLTLVDLAGSEMSIDSMFHTAEQRRECSEINTSLMCLKECIRIVKERSKDSSSNDIDNNKYHIPYRSSKLTMLLKDAFENETDKTLVIATVNPNPKDTEHTLNTLSHVAMMSASENTMKENNQEISSCRTGNDILIPPVRFTHEQLVEWISSTNKGKFNKFVKNIGESVDGKMFCRFGPPMLKRICDGDEKLGVMLKEALNKAIEAEKKQKSERQAACREENVREKLNKAHALTGGL